MLDNAQCTVRKMHRLLGLVAFGALCVTCAAPHASASGFPKAVPAHHSSSPDSHIPPVVFVSRNAVPSSRRGADAGAIPGFGPEYRTVVTGGRLMIRYEDGTMRTLVDGTQLFDVSDPCVSWDGKKILFSGVVHADSNWRIYEIDTDGRGLVQRTYSDRNIDLSQFGDAASRFSRYDDFDPCYLPSGKIVFASTRYPSIASYDQIRTSNLYLQEDDGSLRRITTERNGAEEPTIDPVTGKIVYARWWLNLDRPSNSTRHGLSREDANALTGDVANIWHAVAIRPDGDELKMYAGFPRTRVGSQTYKPAVLDDGTLLSTFSPNTPLTPFIGGTGIRWFKPGADVEHFIIGVPSETYSRTAVAAPPYATDPSALAGKTIVFSYSLDGKDYGIYSCALGGKDLRKLVDLPGTLELDAQAVIARTIPPILEELFTYQVDMLPPTEDPQTYYKNDMFRFDCMNVFTNGAVDEPMPDAPRITTNARIRFFMNVQRQNPNTPDPSILLKDAPVFLEGGVHQHDLPADVPLFEQLVDKEGNVLRTSDGKFAHVAGMNFERMGGGTKCVGCHAGHSMIPVPKNGSLAEWFNLSPSAITAASSNLVLDNRTYGPQHAVDRQAQTGEDTVNWVASDSAGAWISLAWEVPIDLKELVLYGVKRSPAQGTTLVLSDCEVRFYKGSKEVSRISSTGPLLQEGTRLAMDPKTIDSMKLIIKKFSGRFRHQGVAGVAEVETVARISKLNYQLRSEN